MRYPAAIPSETENRRRESFAVFVSFIAVSPNEPVEKVTFLKTVSSAGSKIGNYSLSSKDFTILGVMSLFS